MFLFSLQKPDKKQRKRREGLFAVLFEEIQPVVGGKALSQEYVVAPPIVSTVRNPRENKQEMEPN